MESLRQAGLDAQRAADQLDQLADKAQGEKPSNQQDLLAEKTRDLENQLDRLEKKLNSPDSLSPEEDDSLRHKVGEARKALRSARSAMEEASNRMNQGQRASAEQRAAAEALQRADEALDGSEEDALERLRRQEQQTPELAPEQDELERLTRRRAEEMTDDPDAAQSLQGAADSMDQASESLERSDAQSAREQQEEALEQLEQERQQLEEQQQELANLKMEQQLIDLIGTLGEMATSVEEVLSETRDLDKALDGGRPGRSQRARMRRMAGRLGESEDSGKEVLEALEREQVRVFSYIMKDMLSDLAEAREGLNPGSDPGAETQLLLGEVLEAIQRLRDSLEEELRRRNQQQQPPQPQQQQQQPPTPRLVPTAAELLALKRMQQEVLQRTQRLDARRSDGEELNPLEQRLLERLVHRQGSIIELTAKIAEDLQSQMARPEVQETGPDEAEGGKSSPETSPEEGG